MSTISPLYAANSADSTNSTSSTTSSSSKSTALDLQSFLKLIAAQMQNQSMSDSSSSGDSNSQYITEMTLFSAIQAMNTLTSQSTKQYAASLVGSNVLISTTDSATGKQVTVTGPVKYASFNSTSGEALVHVNDKDYSVSAVTEVLGYAQTTTSDSGDSKTASTTAST